MEAVTESGRPYTVHRYTRGTLDRTEMLRVALAYDGSPYDIGDLREFERAQAMGWTTPYPRTKQWLVCSTGAGLIHEAGGAELWSEQDRRNLSYHEVDPAYYLAEMLGAWRMIFKYPKEFGR